MHRTERFAARGAEVRQVDLDLPQVFGHLPPPVGALTGEFGDDR
ncbi:hypothetical protein ACH4L5_07900 [Streptomyces sp. NPDC017405]